MKIRLLLLCTIFLASCVQQDELSLPYVRSVGNNIVVKTDVSEKFMVKEIIREKVNGMTTAR